MSWIRVPAILITGGYSSGGGVLQSAEVFLPATRTSCHLPGLGLPRYQHTQVIAGAT